MCGINVLVDKTGKVAPEAIAGLTLCTTHRGPDFSTTEMHTAYGQQFYFGHNRLRVLDLSEKANQPLRSADGRYLLLYNGEVYNYRELRRELPNYPFQTESDTEVVLALLATQGKAALPKLNGMFAFVLFDQQEGTLLAARDRFGIKPLFYTNTPDLLLISSELQAITQSGLVPKKLNESQISHYLRYKFARKPETFFQDIQELEEGHALHYQNGRLSTEKLLDDPDGIALSATAIPEPELIRKAEDLLLRSVQRQLAADVPVGLFLSGGTDSTLLLALLAELGHRYFPTFSVNTSAQEQSFGSEDQHFAPLAAHYFGANHTSFDITDELLQNLPDVIAALGQPIADSAALLTWHLSREARKAVTVALSGAGADELFAGYNRHRAYYRFLQHRNKAQVLMPLLRPAAQLLPTGVHHPMRKQFQLLKKMAPAVSGSAWQTFRNFSALQPELHRLLLAPPGEEFTSANEPKTTDALLALALHHDRHQYLISDVLALTDTMSMRHSLEVRLPYLDNELQQFLASVPPQQLFRSGRKWILRDLLKARGGKVFANRRKEGLGLPLGAWLKQENLRWILQPLQNPEHPIFQHIGFDQTQALLLSHQYGRADYSSEIWALVTLAWWLNQHFV